MFADNIGSSNSHQDLIQKFNLILGYVTQMVSQIKITHLSLKYHIQILVMQVQCVL